MSQSVTPPSSDTPLLTLARAYFSAIEAREDPSPFFTEDVVQREFPNQLVPNGATRDLAALREARQRGLQVVTREEYEITNAVERGNELALEVIWRGTLGIPLRSIPVGGVLTAHFGVFLTFRDGRIASQRNYDCFDPF